MLDQFAPELVSMILNFLSPQEIFFLRFLCRAVSHVASADFVNRVHTMLVKDRDPEAFVTRPTLESFFDDAIWPTGNDVQAIDFVVPSGASLKEAPRYSLAIRILQHQGERSPQRITTFVERYFRTPEGKLTDAWKSGCVRAACEFQE